MLGFPIKRISLRGTILSLFFIITTILIFIIGVQLFYFSKKTSLESINLKLHALIENISSTLQNSDNSNFDTIELLSLMNDKTSNLNLYVNILKSHPYIYGIYSGYKDGSFFQVVNLDAHESVREFYKATKEDKWLKIEIHKENPKIREVALLNKELKVNSKKIEETNYVPKERPWYIQASMADSAIRIEPYQFHTVDAIGFTYTKKLQSGNSTVAIDILDDYFKHISKNYIKQDYINVYLFDKNGLILSSLNKNPSLFNSFYKHNKENINDFQEAKIIEVDNKDYIVQINKLNTSYGHSFLAIFSDYDETFKSHLPQILSLLLIFIITTIFIFPIIVFLSNMIINPIYELVKQINKIKDRNYEGIVDIEAKTSEVKLLLMAFKEMASSIFEYQSSLETMVDERTKELKAKNEELKKLSITDKLTNIYNRAKLDSVLTSKFAKSKRYGTNFCVALLDIDLFKEVNDNFGHQIGDDVLVEVAQILQNNIRNTDTLGRFGGEEFLIICPNTDLNGAKTLAININQAVKTHTFKTYPNRLTISIGVASFNENLIKPEDIISNADKALYKAKKSGRDRVIVFESLF